MNKIKTVIVDDSPFSIAYLRGILEENDIEVVGEASTLDEVKAVIKETKPNLVTMDMTLPGTDGLECTRAVLEIDESIKVIVVSSMMDEELIKEAKQSGVSAYVQKPVDSDDFMTAISRVMASDEIFTFLEQEYMAVFKEGLMDGLNRMTKTSLTYKEEYFLDKEYESGGMTVIIGIIGKFSGRMLLDFSTDTAHHLATALLKHEPTTQNELLESLGEFANIVSGNACSILNQKNKALGLRVAPPSILHGNRLYISTPNFKTTTAIAETDFGSVLLNVGFQRSEKQWI